MTPLDFLVFCLAAGVLAGVQLVARGGPENSLIGLNVAVICVVTELVVLNQFYGLAFSSDIAFYLIFPGVFGVIVYARFLRGGAVQVTPLEYVYVFGGLLVLCASLGLARFGERTNIVYARVHLAGVVDVACILLVLVMGQPLVALVYLLLMPLSAHAIANAHFHGGEGR